jgi:hypothetical protein
VEGGFLGGLALGVVPFGGVGHQLLDQGDVLPHGTPEARRGLAVGLIVGGLISLVGGLTGEVVGGVATVTGIGAAVGLPAIAVSTTLVVGGAANVAAGLRGLTQSMMSKGSGSSGPSAAAPVAAGGAKATAGQGYHSFSAFKRAMGPAGPGKNWHHIVEQTKGNVAKFGPETLHNTQNVVRLDAATHRQVSAYYSRIEWFTGGKTVRQWLSTQSFEAQKQFGLQVLKDFGGLP